MHSFLRSCALATIFSLALVTTAKAAEAGNSLSLATPQARSQGILIAEESGPNERQFQFKEMRMVNEMIMQQVKMTDMAMELLQSPNPEIRKMAMETLTNSNVMIEKLMNWRRLTFLPIKAPAN